MRIKTREKIAYISSHPDEFSGFRANSEASKFIYDVVEGKNLTKLVEIYGSLSKVRGLLWFIYKKKKEKEVDVNAPIEKLKIIPMTTSVDLERYSHNLCVGFEFEMAGGNTSLYAEKYKVKPDKTNGIDYKTAKVDLRYGGSINVPTPIDLYKEENVVVQVYHDGTVGVEVVTRPMLLTQLNNFVKPVFDDIKVRNTMGHPEAGLHMTFLTDKLKNNSEFQPIVVQNIMQLVRNYYASIIWKFKATNRNCYFRRFPSYSQMKALSTEHYTAVSLRKENGKIWGIEFRLPDGTNDWRKVYDQALFYAALIRHAAKISQKGLLFIPQENNDLQTKFYSVNGQQMNATEEKKIAQMTADLFKRLTDELFFFSLSDKNSVDDFYETRLETTVEVS